jgi:hypothetical protein
MNPKPKTKAFPRTTSNSREFEEQIRNPLSPCGIPLPPVGQELCAALVNVIDVAQRLKRKEMTTAGNTIND